VNSTLGVGTVPFRSVRYRNRFARPLDRGTGAPTGGRQAMFPGIDIQGLAVGILRKMEKHGGKHGTVDVTKGLVGICFLSILSVMCYF